MSFPEVHEEEAPPEIATMYAELRAAVGIPLVNVIWRHFAALPGVLHWAWAAVRPVTGKAPLVEGLERMETTAVALAGDAMLAFPALTGAALIVVETYNRGN